MTDVLGFAIELAADFSGSGTFTPIGIIEKPARAARTAMEDLRVSRGGSGQATLVHTLATHVYGRCRVASAAPLDALKSCYGAAIALEWHLTVRKLGSLRAMFTIARWAAVAADEGQADISLRLSGVPLLALRPHKKFNGVR